MRIETITETTFMFIGIVMFVKELIDWYIDYRIDKKISDNNKKTALNLAKMSGINFSF